ncbi:hypothetical protein [Ferviditalea candida]|uniref:Transposase n=1 Tax=Ferviditalea candida TaxID=3108399 RepID=A0ABU5ZK39_9BACL|nr:hypothetical protein [Paenibacillaceae bacterium T2]
MAENKNMNPASGEKVETDGVYATEWGREELLKRGDSFPSDVMLGDTEWKLVSLPSEEQQTKINNERGETEKPRLHIDRGDK